MDASRTLPLSEVDGDATPYLSLVLTPGWSARP